MKELLEGSTYTAYTWVNTLYMNQKQFGIQTAHCISRMSRQNKEIYNEWADNHETIVMFDGKNCATLRKIWTIIEYFSHNMEFIGLNIPHAQYHESEDALDGALTCVGFIIPNTLRNFKWGEIQYCKNEPFVALPFQEQVGDNIEIPCTTAEYFSKVERINIAKEKIGNISGQMELHYDKFMFHEFSDWMRNQRSANG